MGPPRLIDLALRQPTRQSSGGADWSRSGAATTGQFTGLFSFSTHVEANPWWEVDLGAVVPVSRIVVWNRDDAGVGGAERARPLTVLVSHDGTEWLPIWKSEAVFGGKSFGKPLTIESLVPIRARFVRLQLDRTEYLHLDQVQVYMAEPPLPFAQVQYGRRDGVMCARIVMKHDSGFFSVCSTLLETIARLHSWSVTTTEIDCSETHTVSRDAGKPADVHAGLFDMDQHVALPDSEDLAASFGPFSSSHCHWHYKTLRFDRITPFVRRFFTPRADILDL